MFVKREVNIKNRKSIVVPNYAVPTTLEVYQISQLLRRKMPELNLALITVL